MTPAYLSLGANVSPRLANLQKAAALLSEIGKVTTVAPLYKSRAYGVSEQPDFYNTAILLNTEIPPLNLLSAVKSIEAAVGRKARYHWGPREIDIDIIFMGQLKIRLPGLHIPHADYANRRFVLKPLCDIDPDFKPPDTHRTLAELLADMSDCGPLTLIQTDWMVNASKP